MFLAAATSALFDGTDSIDLTVFFKMVTDWFVQLWKWISGFCVNLLQNPLFAMGITFMLAFVILRIIRKASPAY